MMEHFSIEDGLLRPYDQSQLRAIPLGLLIMRLVFLGSPEAALGPLKILSEKAGDYGHELVGVVSQPARPTGRKQLLQDPPVAKFAKERGILVLQPEKASDPTFLTAFRDLMPDVAITAAYGQILSPYFLSIPRRATINIHPSLLPKYRGATPVPAALLAGDKESGVTILFTVQKLDAGSIICQKATPLAPDEMAGDLTKRYFDLGGELLFAALEKLKDPTFTGTPQDESLVSHCRKIDKNDGLVNWNLSASDIYNRFRAHHPWPGTFTFHDNKRIQITEMRPQISTEGAISSNFGEITFDKPTGSLSVSTGFGKIHVLKVKPAGGKEINASSFWNGLQNRKEVMFTSNGHS